MTRSVRICNMVEKYSQKTEEYIPKLYLPWEDIQPHIKEGETEHAMLAFADALQESNRFFAATAHQRWNLSDCRRYAWKILREDRRFIIILSDKNMGSIIMERATYLWIVWEDHLSNVQAYERLDPEYAIRRMKKVRQTLEALMKRHADALGDALSTYFSRARSKRKCRVP